MRKKLLFMCVLWLIFNSSVVHADAEMILEKCKLAISDANHIDRHPVLAGIDIGFCLGYIRGLSDYATGTADMTAGEIESFKSCRPSSVDNKQLARIVVNFLENNPKYHHFDQTTLVALALKDAFPCD